MKSILILTNSDTLSAFNYIKQFVNNNMFNLYNSLITFGDINVLDISLPNITPEYIMDLYFDADVVILMGYVNDTTKVNNIVELLLISGIPIIVTAGSLNYTASYGYYGLQQDGYSERTVYSSFVEPSGNNHYINNYINEIYNKNISPVYNTPLYSIPYLQIPLLYCSSSSYHIMGYLPPSYNIALNITQKAPLFYMGMIKPFSYSNSDTFIADAYTELFKDVFTIIDGCSIKINIVKGRVKVDNILSDRTIQLYNQADYKLDETISNMSGEYVLKTIYDPPFKAICQPYPMDNASPIIVENADYYTITNNNDGLGYLNIFVITSINIPLQEYKDILSNDDIKNTLGTSYINYFEYNNTGQYRQNIYKSQASRIYFPMENKEIQLEVNLDYSEINKSNMSFTSIISFYNIMLSNVCNISFIVNNNNVSINIDDFNSGISNMFTQTDGATIIKGIFTFKDDTISFTNTYEGTRNYVADFSKTFNTPLCNNIHHISFYNDISLPINDDSFIYTVKKLNN